ncbi:MULTISPECIES: hypothetical protein [Pseudoalteromonas]|uniref:hypothetical protein n=1 Tax=Pseudoalteromonas TaxID=53246 RepID=UPI00057CF391|nr:MULTISPECIES: hypothetical protein [Pseudoalteromonas]KID37186.1 hypothetical protein QT15_07725 [Pseudoalteromonas flavipulchra NCIMB 2033 = ATCC BAA-314]MBD0783000.1 hypothetical protein [Pseudoalteromonas flavipulchra]MBE0374745.1 hypothetical protein [Pseudoalteromonas flavipulchra NCIMB 2033 = ATCC BAA-314]RZG13470.1 hypothetical protein EXT47_17565 [Pseudoalteromonas sp. CO342X]
MKVLNKVFGATVLALGVSAGSASAAEVKITEVDYGSVVIQTADVVLNHSQAGTFSMNVSENHLTVNAQDSNGRKFRCVMNGTSSYSDPAILERVTNIAATISEGDRVQIEVQKNVLPQVCHVKKMLSF